MRMFGRTGLLAGALLVWWGCEPFESSPTAEMRAQEEAIAKQAAAANEKSAYEELAPIRTGTRETFGALRALCQTPDGNLVVGDCDARAVLVLTAEGKVLATWKLGLMPQAVAAHSDGSVYVGGEGKLARLDKAGKLLKSVEVGSDRMSALATTDKDVFLSAWLDTGFAIYRLDHELDGRTKIADGLRGCCGTLDIATREGALYVAENARHRVVKYDRDGNVLAKWGVQDREAIESFSGCCNPMNLCLGAGGEVYTAESGPDRVKRYTADGKYLELINWFAGGKSCRCVDLAVSRDGSRVYVADSGNNTIRVLGRKEAKRTAALEGGAPAAEAAPGGGPGK